jgi:hypothetical protein
MTRNIGLTALFLPNIKTIKHRMNGRRDVGIGKLFRHKERNANGGKGM